MKKKTTNKMILAMLWIVMASIAHTTYTSCIVYYSILCVLSVILVMFSSHSKWFSKINLMQLQLLDFNEMHIFDIKKLLSIDWQWEISLKSLEEKKKWNMLMYVKMTFYGKSIEFPTEIFLFFFSVIDIGEFIGCKSMKIITKRWR